METKLERNLGLWSVIALGLGTTLGTGIFSTFNVVAAISGSAFVLIIAYTIGGLLQIPSNFCYAELSSAYPENGGYYIYVREAGNPLLAFLCGWASFWALDPPSISIMALGLVSYMGSILPFSNIALQCISVLIILFFMIANIMSVKAGSIIQGVLTLLKIIPFIIVIGIGIFFINPDFIFANTTGGTVTAESSAVGLFTIFAAIATTTFSYDGMYAPSYMTGEVKNPKRTMPIAFITIAIIVIVLYVSLSVVSTGVLSMDELALSSAPIVDVAAHFPVIGDYSGLIVAIMAILVIVGSISSVIMYQPRLGYAMAKDGYFFSIFGKVHPKFKSPYCAIIIHCVYAIILSFVSDLSTLLGYLTLITLIRNFSTFASIFFLRKKDSYNPPYKCPLGLFCPIISCLVTGLLIIGIIFEYPVESLCWLLALWGTGIVAFYLWNKKKNNFVGGKHSRG